MTNATLRQQVTSHQPSVEDGHFNKILELGLSKWVIFVGGKVARMNFFATDKHHLTIDFVLNYHEPERHVRSVHTKFWPE